jgi:hypothetical protein
LEADDVLLAHAEHVELYDLADLVTAQFFPS